MTMKKLQKYTLLRGYVNGNLGDDLFIKIICSRYSNVPFMLVGSKKFKCTFKDVKNLKYVCSDSIIYKCVEKICQSIGRTFKISSLKYFTINRYLYLKYCKKVKLNVIISGSYFIEWNDDREYWKYFFKRESKYYQYHPVVMGINFGPYYTEEYKRNCIHLLAEARFITVRDKETKCILQELNPNYAPDIVFLFESDGGKLKVGDSTPNICIVVSSNSSTNDIYLNALIRIIKEYNNAGYHVNLIRFCDSEGDYLVSNKICDAAGNLITNNVSYNGQNTDEIMTTISKSSLVFAGRFHAMILGWLFHVPTIPICYSKKMEAVINDIVPNTKYYMSDTIEIIDFDVEKMISSISKPNLCKVIGDAKSHFKYLDDYFCETKRGE